VAAQVRSLAALFLALTILVTGCGPLGKQGAEEERRAMENSQFAELMKRPDIETIAKRSEEVGGKIRAKLIEGKFVAAWQERAGSSGGGGCGRSYPEVSSADTDWRALNRWTAEGNLSDEKWVAAVAAVAEIAREYGYGEPKIVVNRPRSWSVQRRTRFSG
jgi:hypothetical protein